MFGWVWLAGLGWDDLARQIGCSAEEKDGGDDADDADDVLYVLYMYVCTDCVDAYVLADRHVKMGGHEEE